MIVRDPMGKLGLSTNLAEKLNMGLLSPFKFERFWTFHSKKKILK